MNSDPELFDAVGAVDRVVLALSQHDYEGIDRPLMIAVGEPVGLGRSVFVRSLFAELFDLKLKCSLVPVSGFYLPRALLRERGLLDQKGRPSTIDMQRCFETLARVRQVRLTGQDVWHPVYTAMHADPLWPTERVTATTDVVIVEGAWFTQDFAAYSSELRDHVDQIWRLDESRSNAVAEFPREA